MKIESQLSTQPAPRTRETVLDIWRGVAVMSMIITHVIAFFYNGTESVIGTLGLIGGTISFGLFLFISGTTAYLSFAKYDPNTDRINIQKRRRGMLYRTAGILFGYYVVAHVASLGLYSFPPNTGWIENTIRILTFYNIPEFVEFIIPFILFPLSLILLRRFYRFIVHRPILLFGVAGLLYVLGSLLYFAQVDPLFVGIKSILVGHEGLHRFPIFQYAAVYMLGMLWGRFMSRVQTQSYRSYVALLATVASGILMLAGSVAAPITGLSILETWLRWPPSLTFLTIGLFATYLSYLVLQLTNNLKLLGYGQTLLKFAGVNAFDYFVFHTSVLYLIQFATKWKTDSGVMIFIAFTALILVTTFLTVFKDNTVDSLKAESDDEGGVGWVFSERVIVGGIWMVLVFIVGISLYQQQVSATTIDPQQISFKKRLITEQQWPFWWDHSYGNFREIFIDNQNSTATIARNTWFALTIDHADLVRRGLSAGNGNDVRIVFYDDALGGFLELPFIFEGIGANATIKFKLQQDILPGVRNDKYFIYYNNSTSTAYPAAQDRPLEVRSTNISLGDEQRHLLSGSTNRKWLVKQTGVSLNLRTLLYTVTLDPTLAEDSIVTYRVEGTNLRGSMESQGGRKYQASIRVSDLNPGIYRVQAVARQPQARTQLVTSGYTPFYVTYPLYVTWTQDWEGPDVSNDRLNGLNEMANRWGIPLTHFFNPRIYVQGVMSAERAAQLTVWVLDRAKNYNDEIGLHLHMWYDMVRTAGVTPRTSPYANWLYGDGGGVPAYAYTTEEFKKILNWSRTMFQEHGIPQPISFRAGGWLLKEHTLQALEETAFLIDSSGRTYPVNPRQRAFAPPWNLTETTGPYKPNKTDMNKDTTPTFNIWEFPNNGADSYWYDAGELIRRFDLNYPNKGGILEKPQVLTYLSHPPFFFIDKPKMEQVFRHISSYLYKNDAGPVIYTTLENAYYSWDR